MGSNHLRTFYIMTMTQVLSLIGSRMTQFALGVWIYTETGQTTPMMLVLFFSTLPMMFGGSLAGVFADRWDRRKLIMATDAGQAIPTLLIMLSFLTNNFEVWQLYLTALVQTTFGMLQGSAVDASVTMLVPDEKRDVANGLRQATGPLAGLIAPMIGGLLYVLVGVEGILLIDVITFLIAVGVISQMHIPMPPASAEGHATRGSVWQEVKGGVDFLRQRPTLFWLLIYLTAFNFVVAGPANLLSPYFLELTDSQRTLGILLGITNIGPIAGALLMGSLSRNTSRMTLIMRGLVFLCAWMVLVGIARSPLTLAFTTFMVMLPLPLINGTFMSIMQIKTPPDMQGRVFALVMQLSAFAVPFSFLVTGPLVDQVFEPAVNSAAWEMFAPIWGQEAGAGMGLLLSLCAVVVLGMTGVVFAIPRMRRLEADLPDYTPETQEEKAMPVGAAVAA